MAAKKAESVSLKSLASSIDKAVKIASARHKAAFEKATISSKWEIYGRILRQMRDMNVAFDIASDIAKQVQAPGIKAVPVVTQIGGDTFVGFMDKGNSLKSLNL